MKGTNLSKQSTNTFTFSAGIVSVSGLDCAGKKMPFIMMNVLIKHFCFVTSQLVHYDQTHITKIKLKYYGVGDFDPILFQLYR